MLVLILIFLYFIIFSSDFSSGDHNGELNNEEDLPDDHEVGPELETILAPDSSSHLVAQNPSLISADVNGGRSPTVSSIGVSENPLGPSTSTRNIQNIGLEGRRMQDFQNFFNQAMQGALNMLKPVVAAPVSFSDNKGRVISLSFDEVAQLYFKNETAKQTLEIWQQREGMLVEENKRLVDANKNLERQIKNEKDKRALLESQQAAKDKNSKDINEKLGLHIKKLEGEKDTLVLQKETVTSILATGMEDLRRHQEEINSFPEKLASARKEISNQMKEKITKAVSKENEKWVRRESEWTHAKNLLLKQLEEEKGFTEEERKKAQNERRKTNDLTLEFQNKIADYISQIEELQESQDQEQAERESQDNLSEPPKKRKKAGGSRPSTPTEVPSLPSGSRGAMG